jgi:hypothetical protein
LKMRILLFREKFYMFSILGTWEGAFREKIYNACT